MMNFQNNHMACRLNSIHFYELDRNIAIVQINGTGYAVVNGVDIDLTTNKGSWNFAYGYDMTLQEATELFIEKIK